MPQEPTYRDKVYDALKGELGDSFSKTRQEFDDALSTDKEYQKKVYAALKGELGDSFSKSEDEFYSMLKKKDGTSVSSETSSTTASPSASPEDDRIGQEIANADPDNSPLLKKLSARTPWLAAPINYLTGAIRGTAPFILDVMNGGQKTFYRAIGTAMEASKNPSLISAGAALKGQQEQDNWWKQASDATNKFVEEKMPPKIGAEGSPYKKDLLSSLLYGFGEVTPMLMTLPFTPNPSIVGVGLRLQTNFAAAKGFGEYGRTDDIKQSIKEGLIGVGDASAIALTGYAGSKAGMGVTKALSKRLNPRASGLIGASTAAGVMGIGGWSHSLASQISRGTKLEDLDFEAANESAAMFVGFGIPGILQAAATTYGAAPKEAILETRKTEADITDIREQAIKLEKESFSETSLQAKAEKAIAADALHKTANIKAIDQLMARDPEAAKKWVKEQDITDAEKAIWNEKIEDSALNAEYQKQLEQTKDLSTAGDVLAKESTKGESKPVQERVVDDLGASDGKVSLEGKKPPTETPTELTKVGEMSQKKQQLDTKRVEDLDRLAKEGESNDFATAYETVKRKTEELRKTGEPQEVQEALNFLAKLEKDKDFGRMTTEKGLHDIADVRSDIEGVMESRSKTIEKETTPAKPEPPQEPPQPPAKPPVEQLEEGLPKGKRPTDDMEVISSRRKVRRAELKKRNKASRWDWRYLVVNQVEPFSGAVLKAAKQAGRGKKMAQRIVDRKNTERGAKSQTALDFSTAMKRIGAGLFGRIKVRDLDLVSEYSDVRRTNELYKSREAMGKETLLEEGGLTLAQSENFLTRVRNKDPELLKEFGLKDYKFEDIKKASDQLNDMYRDILDELLSENLITKASYDQIVFEHPYYSPRKYMEVMDMIDGGAEGGIISALGKGSEGAKVVDAASLIHEAISRKNNAVFKARTYRAMEKYIDEVNPDFMRQAKYSTEYIEKVKKQKKEQEQQQKDLENKPPGEKVEQVKSKWIDPTFESTPRGMSEINYIDSKGQKRRFFMNEDVYKYFDVQPFGDLARKTMNVLGWISGSKILKAAATGYNPEFMVKNVPIDMMHILNTTDVYTGVLAVDYPMMLMDMQAVAKDVLLRKGVWKDYIAQGGGMKMLSGEGRLREGISVKHIRKSNQAIDALEDVASYFGETSEYSTRLALRRRKIINLTKEFLEENGREPSASELKEIELDGTAYARNYLDFEQGGRIVKMADSVIPYLNAGFQVTRGSLRAIGDNPLLWTAKVGQLAGVAAAMAAWNLGMIHHKGLDDETRDGMRNAYLNDISDEVKAKNFVLMLPKKYTDAGGNERYQYWKLQKDNVQELITGVAEDAMLKKYLGPEFKGFVSPKRRKELQAMTQSFTNISQLPPAVRGALGYEQNLDLYYKSPIWPGADGSGDFGKDKSLEQRADTPARYKTLGKIPLPGGHRLSPMRSQYFAKQFVTESNVIGTGIGVLMDKAVGGVNKEMIETYEPSKTEKWGKVPFRRRFIKSTYPGAAKRDKDTHTNEYNKLKQEHNLEFDAMIKEESPPDEIMSYLENMLTENDFNVTSGVEYQRLMRRYENKVLKPITRSWLTGLKYEPAIPRAEELFDQWVIMNDDMRNYLVEQAVVEGLLTGSTLSRFSELMVEYNEESTPTSE